MFKLKFLDGSPVDKGYADAVSTMVSGAAAATEFVSEDELEAFAERQKQAKQTDAGEVGV
jgi:hypothetical protein